MTKALSIFPFRAQAIITAETLKIGLYCLPLVPLGVWIGVWLNGSLATPISLK
jgi:hypothetical protein